METKVCIKCGIRKGIDQYHKAKQNEDGHKNTCGDCHKKYLKIWFERKPSEYNVWLCMKKRCNTKNHRSYKYYGARGIKVCKEWQNSFKQFYKDMGSRPTSKHRLDRIDNDKGYSPENCQWLLEIENIRKQTNVKLNMKKANEIRKLYNKGNISMHQLAFMYDVKPQQISRIINYLRWA